MEIVPIPDPMRRAGTEPVVGSGGDAFRTWNLATGMGIQETINYRKESSSTNTKESKLSLPAQIIKSTKQLEMLQANGCKRLESLHFFHCAVLRVFSCKIMANIKRPQGLNPTKRHDSQHKF